MLRKITAEERRQEKDLKKLKSLIEHVENHSLPQASLHFINKRVETVNNFSGTAPEFSKKINIVKKDIFDYLRKEHDLVSEKFYTYLWMPLGMCSFGLPLGVVVFAITENPAFLTLGLPLGLAMGAILGSYLDKKAAKEGRVLHLGDK